MAIIGVSGYGGSGKDTVGIIIQYLLCKPGKPPIEAVLNNIVDNKWWLEEGSSWEVKQWGAKLKDIASHITGIDVEKFEDQEFKKTNLGSEWDCNPFGKVGTMYKQPLTVRELLQRIGTDAMRNGLHPNVWVNALMSDYIPENIVTKEDTGFNGQWVHVHTSKDPNWIITDTRFINETVAIKEKKGITIRVDRPGFGPINDHPSEVGLDDYPFDYKIANVSDIVSLMFSVEQILKHAKILK